MRKGAHFQDVFKDGAKAAAEANSKQLKLNLGNDRLLEDKIYLSMLAQSVGSLGIPEENPESYEGVDSGVRAVANDALNFLRSRHINHLQTWLLGYS